MTLGGGLYGPVLNVEPRGKKYWPPPSNHTRTQYVIGLIKDKDIKEYIFKTWLEMCKHYDADYYEEDRIRFSFRSNQSSQNARETR